jgi:hypothetical protein
MPVKPSQGVLFLLQRNGLMAVNQSVSDHSCDKLCLMQRRLQGETPDYIFWISIPITHTPRPALGIVVTVSPNGRGAGTV